MIKVLLIAVFQPLRTFFLNFFLALGKNFLSRFHCLEISFNDLYTSEQINHIQNGINIIKQRLITDKPSQLQIEKSIQWCEKYKLPINQGCFYL